jgi:hypothetical protein
VARPYPKCPHGKPRWQDCHRCSYAEGYKAGVEAGVDSTIKVGSKKVDQIVALVVEALRDHHSPRSFICLLCKGTGFVPGAEGQTSVQCTACHGSGKV